MNTTIFILTGLASIYHPNAAYVGEIRADGKRFEKNQCHIAHRWIPLGTSVRVCNKNKCTTTKVLDRGPYGACDKKGVDKWGRCRGDWKIITRSHTMSRMSKEGWRWRTIVDMTPCIARRIGITGIQEIRIEL